MNWLAQIVRHVRDFFRPRYRAVYSDDLPDNLVRQKVYLIGEDRDPWQAAMVCPCGCEAKIQLSLLPDDEPSWRAAVDGAGIVTLHPSIWRTRGCYAHFFIHQGKIKWAKDSGRAR